MAYTLDESGETFVPLTMDGGGTPEEISAPLVIHESILPEEYPAVVPMHSVNALSMQNAVPLTMQEGQQEERLSMDTPPLVREQAQQRTTGAVLFVGGTRSGKSDLALRFAEAQAAQRCFIATALVRDDETRARKARHQAQRGHGWHTVEAPVDVLAALQAAATQSPVLVLDCITFWLCNMQEQGLTTLQIVDTARTVAAWLASAPVPVAVVTAELGQGVVPVSELGRAFRDMAGEVNQILAAACSVVILVSCGLPLALKGTVPEELR